MYKLELTKTQEERAAELWHNEFIVDALSGWIVHPEPPPVDGKIYLDRVIENHYGLVSMTVTAHSDDFDRAMEEVFHYCNLFQVAANRVMHVKKPSDIDKARKEKKLGIMFGFQTPTPINEHFYRWTIFQQLGLRLCQLSYMERTIFGDGCYEPENRGLTYYGIQAVQEMNRLGIVVDLSHAGERTALEAAEKSTKPVVYSHSNARALSPSKRNITDEQITSVVKKGGVVGLTPHSVLTCKEWGVRPTMLDYLDQFEYLAKLIGTDHIGIGTDVFEAYTKFSWETSTKLFYNPPYVFETMLSEGFTKVDGIKEVIRGLVARGFSDEDIRKILGGNFVRVFKACWREDF